MALDPNTHIQEVKALACDIRPGRRPRGRALAALVDGHRRSAGITDQTGREM
jgi:formate dehydrogenase major subunit